MSILPSQITVAALQWDIQTNDFAANKAKCDHLLQQALEKKATVVVLPEMWSRGFCGRHLVEEARELPQRLAYCADKAKRHRLWFAAGTFPEPAPSGKVFNTFYLFDDEGEIRLKYRKMHLFPNTGEPTFFDPGTDIPNPYETGDWSIGAAICFDLRFPELFRPQMKRGANLFFVPAQFPDPRLDHFILLSQARALENLAFLVATNCCGTQKHLTFPGNSLLLGPMGNIVAHADRQEGLCLGTFSCSEGQKIRRDFPFLELTPLLK